MRSGRVLVLALVCLATLGGCASGPEPAGQQAGAPFTPDGGQAPGGQAVDGPASGGSDPGGVRYLALGDSLTQGVGTADMDTGAFPALLAQRWRDQGCPVELRNAGISGYTAGQVVSEQLPAVAEFNPNVITFQAGGNDIATGVSLEDYRAGARQVLDTAKASGARVIVLAQNEWFRSPEGLNYGTEVPQQRAAYDAALIEEITAHGAEFVDLRELYRRQADENLWVEDGLHPTPQAYAAWADELARAVPAPCR